VPGKAGFTPEDTPEVLVRLGLDVPQWLGLVRDFERAFSLIAGLPETIARHRSRLTHRSFHLRRPFRELFATQAA
jgi:hypothetical protein